MAPLGQLPPSALSSPTKGSVTLSLLDAEQVEVIVIPISPLIIPNATQSAEYLQVRDAFIRRMIKQDMPYSILGNRLRFVRGDLMEWVRTQTPEQQEELQQERERLRAAGV